MITKFFSPTLQKLAVLPRKSLLVILSLTFGFSLPFAFSGCTTPTDEYGRTRPSTQSWSRPQSWEGAGPLGVIQSQQERQSNRDFY